MPDLVWKKVREIFILLDQNRCAKICDRLLKEYKEGLFIQFPQKSLMDFKTDKIIWQYWGQGQENAPEIVRICMESIVKHKSDYQLVILNDENISEYIELPRSILEKKDSFCKAHFSDLLRLSLLATYGGVWIDATILLTSDLPQKLIFGDDFFMFQRDDNEPYKEYFMEAYAYYWGWNEKFKVRLLNSIIYSKKGNKVISDMLNIIYSYWLKNNCLPHYFFFQILYNQYISLYPERNCRIESDSIPQYFLQNITDDFPFVDIKEAISMSPIHKMTYKMSAEKVNKFKKVIEKYNII